MQSDHAVWSLNSSFLFSFPVQLQVRSRRVYAPMAVQPLTNWNSGLFSCCDNMSSCKEVSSSFSPFGPIRLFADGDPACFSGCYGFWCCPCLACSVSGQAGANRCLPLCDIFSPAVLSACSVPLFVPPALLSVRVGLRQRYGIKVRHV